MSGPDHALLGAAMEALRPFVVALRENGWATEVTAHAEPLRLTLEIDLSGLKRPTQEAEPVSATRTLFCPFCHQRIGSLTGEENMPPIARTAVIDGFQMEHMRRSHPEEIDQ